MEAAVITLAVCLCLVTLAAAGSVPLLWWRIDRLEREKVQLRQDVDKLDAAMESVLSLVHGENK
jgi:hypothetical protein